MIENVCRKTYGCIVVLLQAKLEARKARRLAEEGRLADEGAAKQFVDEQERQMKGATAQSEADAFFKPPSFEVAESGEEKALRKDQVRTNHNTLNFPN